MFEDEPRLKEPRRRRNALHARCVELTNMAERQRRDFTPSEHEEYNRNHKECDRIYREEIHPVQMELARELDARIAARGKPSLAEIREAVREYPDEAMLVAVHESGHACLSILEARGTESVQVDFQKEGAGWKPVSGNHVARRGPYSKVALMAGVAAGLIEFNDSPPTMGEPEPGPLPCWDRSLRGDLARVAEKYLRTHQSGSLKTLAREDIAEARSILLRSWPSVVAVAQGLLKTGYLDGDTAEKIAIDAMPPHQRNGARRKLEHAAYLDRQRKERAS